MKYMFKLSPIQFIPSPEPMFKKQKSTPKQKQTCKVVPHYEDEPCQVQEASHKSNICDKPCGTGENLNICMDRKHI